MTNAFLIGKRTYLRPVELADTHLIQEWHNDPRIRTLARLGELPVTYMQEEDDIRTAKQTREEIYLMIVEKSSNRAIGFIRLNFMDRVSRNMWLRMIIGVADARGKNLAEDALRSVLKWLFSEQNVHRVTLETYETNKRAISFFEKMGFKQEGILREAVYVGGKYYDMIALGLLSRDFKNK
jgi:ribosomal-protein-alanine N-acetyltransferase